MIASNFWVFPTNAEEVDLHLISTCRLMLSTQGGGGGKYSNRYWGEIIFNAKSISNDAWGVYANPRLAYLPRIPVNPCAV